MSFFFRVKYDLAFKGVEGLMIRDEQNSLYKILVVIDILTILISYFLAWFIVIGNPGSKVTIHNRQVMAFYYLITAMLIVPLFILLYAGFHLYISKFLWRKKTEFTNIFKANIIGILIISCFLFLGGKNIFIYNFSRPMLLIFLILNILFETIVRCNIRKLWYIFYEKDLNQKHILLIGYSRAAEEFIDRVLNNPNLGYKIYGILDDKEVIGRQYKDISVVNRLSALSQILEESMLNEVAITLDIDDYIKLKSIVAICEKSGVHTQFIPDYSNVFSTIPYIDDFQGLPIIHIRRVPLTNCINRAVKRVLDIFGSCFALILFLPIMLITAIIIKLTSPGPILFSQERVGLHNRRFKIYKFRSMEVQNKEKEKSHWTRPGDDRVTAIGRFIRKFSIDEMPQLFNVLKGEMSLVGPRPERPFFVDCFKEEIPRYMIKHQVRPGMTGWAQINGYRGDTSISKRIECDLYYIENWTLGFDFKILLLTVFKGFINKNAY